MVFLPWDVHGGNYVPCELWVGGLSGVVVVVVRGLVVAVGETVVVQMIDSGNSNSCRR